MREILSGRRRVRLILIGMLVLVGAGVAGTSVANAVVTAPSPGVVLSGFCTYGKGYYSNSTVAAQQINTYELGVAIGNTLTYDWLPTNTNVVVGAGNKAVTVDQGTAWLQQAIGSGGTPGAFSASATNSTDMGTGRDLASQTLAQQINEDFGDFFISSATATGTDSLSLVNMAGVSLAGSRLTSAQANALNGQAAVQVLQNADVALGDGVLPYGLSFAQLTGLLSSLNGAFDGCGAASSFAKAHLYQPFLTSNAFTGKRASTVSTGWASKPTYNTFSGTVSNVPNLGCDAGDFANFPVGDVALIERGTCTFVIKVLNARAAGASAAIIYNRTDGFPCPAVPTPGSSACEALFAMGGGVPSTIPAAFVQRSTGLALLNGAAPVTVFVQQ
jgi:PA domain